MNKSRQIEIIGRNANIIDLVRRYSLRLRNSQSTG